MSHRDRQNAVEYWRQFPLTVEFAKVGDEVWGTITDLGEVKYRGEFYPRLKILSEHGEIRIVTVFWTRLMNRLKEEGPAVGDNLRIKYVGDEPAVPGMTPAKRFAVAVERPGESRPAEEAPQ